MPFNIFNKKDQPMNPPSMTLNLGLGGLKPKSTSITNDYTISSRTLGVGINGKVVECFCKKTHQKYALKALRKSAKAFREVSLHWKVRTHDNIVNVIDVYENTFSGTKCYLMVMECMEGGELFERIQSKGDNGFTEKEASKITRQICEALLVLHNSNIAHRDVKPENLLYLSKDIKATLKLTDFGFASEIIAGQLKTPCFTPYYAAPEVLGPEKYDMSCDMWSLGVIIYILLCGYPPFHTEGGAPMSPGMKKKIRQGDYNFPDPEWTYVSASAKGLIRGLLCTDVLKRLDIRQCMNHPWIKDNDTVPETPLMSARILNEEEDMWCDKKEEMSNALNAMRIDYDNVIRVADMTAISMNNPILKRRQNKKTEETAPALYSIHL